MKRSALFLILIAAVLVAGLAFTAQVLSGTQPADVQALSAANALVVAGHYAEAAQIYEQLAAQGAPSAPLFYNLGNAYFLQGDTNRAVRAYEAAAELAPRDPDVRHNLELARSQTTGIALAQPAGPLGELSTLTGRWLTINELAVIALGAWFLLGFFIVAYRHFQAGRRPAGLRIVAALTLIAVVLTGTALMSRIAGQEARSRLSPAAQMAEAPSLTAVQ